MSPALVAATIESIPGVKNVHDLHIWAVEPRLIMMTTHVQVDGGDQALTTDLLQTIRNRVTNEFKIKHQTIQLETECCHPEAVHCDLSKLHDQHSHAEFCTAITSCSDTDHSPDVWRNTIPGPKPARSTNLPIFPNARAD